MGGSEDWDEGQRAAGGVELPAVALVVGGDGDPQQMTPPRPSRPGEERQRLLPSDVASSSSSVVRRVGSSTGLTPRHPSMAAAAQRSPSPFQIGGGGGGGRAETAAVAGGMLGGSSAAKAPDSARKWTRGYLPTSRPPSVRGACASAVASTRRSRRLLTRVLLFLPVLGGVIAMLSTLHVLLLRRAAASRLGSVLAIISAAEYFPLERNGLHATLAIGPEGAAAAAAGGGGKARRLQEQAQAQAQDKQVVSEKGGAGAGAGAGPAEEAALEVDGLGAVAAVDVPASEAGQQPPQTEQQLRKTVSVGGLAGGPLGPQPSLEGSRAPMPPAPRPPQQAVEGPGATCALTYLMNVTEQAARKMDVDEYDKMLLGTIMVRLCNCGCARESLGAFSLASVPEQDEDQAAAAAASAASAAPAADSAAGAEGDKMGALPPPPKQKQPPPDDSLRLMSEILRGAHIVVEGDRGAFYSWFTQMQDSYRRTSSHLSSAPMYGIDEGSVLRTVLTGRDLDGSTWLQFEGAGWDPWRRPMESFIHMVNYMQYKLTSRQVGPLGVSVYTDSNPIRLRFDGCFGAPGGSAADGAGGDGEDGGRSLFRQYPPDDPTGKNVKPSHRRWDEAFEAARGKFRATLSSYWSSSEEPTAVAAAGAEGGKQAVVGGEADAAPAPEASKAAVEAEQEGHRGLRRRRVEGHKA